jgi:hypothetical protein
MEGFIKQYLSGLFKAGIIKKFKIDGMGNIMAIKGEGFNGRYPAIACHVDTVHAIVEDFKLFEYTSVDNAPSRHYDADSGIGGDDKCGIFIALSLLNNKRIKNLKAFFYVQEETGCKGALASVKNKGWYDDLTFIAEGDRRGSTDLIITCGGTDTVSKDFKEMLLSHGKEWLYDTANGSFSDVMRIQKDLKVSAFNFSVGYYNPHQADEFIDESSLLKAKDFIKSLFIRHGMTIYPFIPEVKVYKNTTTTQYGGRIYNYPFLTSFGSEAVLTYSVNEQLKSYNWSARLKNGGSFFLSSVPGWREIELKMEALDVWGLLEDNAVKDEKVTSLNEQWWEDAYGRLADEY